MVTCPECQGGGCSFCMNNGRMATLQSLMKYRQAICREEAIMKDNLTHFGKVADIVKGESFERWAKDVLLGKFEHWMALHIGADVSSPQGIMFSGDVSDEVWPMFYAELSRVHLGESTRDMFQGPPPEIFERGKFEGLVVGLVHLAGLSNEDDVDQLRVSTLENLLLLIEAAENDLLEIWESLDECDGFIKAVKGIRSLRKLHAKEHAPKAEPVKPKEMQEHRCWQCSKAGVVTDDDGTWYCKKHAYPLGLLDRPKVEDEEPEPEEPQTEEQVEAARELQILNEEIDLMPAAVRRRFGR